MTDPRILMFGWEFPPHISGGLGTACAGLVRALAEAGTDLTLVLPFGTEAVSSPNLRLVTPQTFQLKPPGLTPYPYPGHGGRPSSNRSGRTAPAPAKPAPEAGGHDYRAAAEEYGRFGALVAEHTAFDLIHCHDWLTAPAGIRAKQLSGKPLILHVHSLEVERSGANADAGIVKIETRALREADLIIAVSHTSRWRIIQLYGISPRKIHVVHNAAEQMPSPPSRPAHPLTVSFIGRVTWQKGPDWFVEAALAVQRECPEARFVLAGDGDLLPILRRRARAFGLPMEFPGFLSPSEVRNLLTQTDLLVMPSRFEPFGIAALEAALAGALPIISQACGVREVLPMAPLVASPGTAELASTIADLLKAGPERRFLAGLVQQAARKRTWTRAAAEVLALYQASWRH